MVNFSSGPIKKLHDAAVDGNLKAFQGSLKSIPPEALFTIAVPELANKTVNPFPGQTDDIVYDTKNMTIFGLICAL